MGGFTPTSFEHHAEVRCLFVLHSVSDSSSICEAKRGDAWLSGGDRDGEDVRSRRHGYTRLEKMRGERRVQRPIQGRVIQNKQAKRRRTKKKKIIGSILHEEGSR